MSKSLDHSTAQPGNRMVHSYTPSQEATAPQYDCEEAEKQPGRRSGLLRKPNRLPSPRSAAMAVLLSGRPVLLRTRMAVVTDVSATLAERQKALTPTGAGSRSCAPLTLC